MNPIEELELRRLRGVPPSKIKLKKRIDSGGISDIWLAAYEGVSKPFVVKYSRYSSDGNDYLRGHFEREFEASQVLLRHHKSDGTALVVECDTDVYHHLYLYTEYFRAHGLNVLTRRVCRWETVRRILSSVVRIFRDFHGAGIVHRDIKPSNILVSSSGEVRIIDFALSTIDGVSHRFHERSMALGTPLYMSPEQACGMHVDLACDWYSLGALLYEWLTGDVPFRGVTAAQTMHMHCEHPVPPIVNRQIPDAPDEFLSIVPRLLSKTAVPRIDAAYALIELLSESQEA